MLQRRGKEVLVRTDMYEPIPRSELHSTIWHNMGRVGYLGSSRDGQWAQWDEQFGAGNWRLVWMVGDSTLSFLNMCAVYENSYFALFQRNPDVLEELVTVACNVYDDDPTNVHSGSDYSIQETSRTHIQDIAIRRAVQRSNRSFCGEHLLQIRDKKGEHPFSLLLSPGRVPFEHLAWIQRPQLRGWWSLDSVEAFYQSNRHLLVRSAAFSS